MQSSLCRLGRRLLFFYFGSFRTERAHLMCRWAFRTGSATKSNKPQTTVRHEIEQTQQKQQQNQQKQRKIRTLRPISLKFCRHKNDTSCFSKLQVPKRNRQRARCRTWIRSRFCCVAPQGLHCPLLLLVFQRQTQRSDLHAHEAKIAVLKWFGRKHGNHVALWMTLQEHAQSQLTSGPWQQVTPTHDLRRHNIRPNRNRR